MDETVARRIDYRVIRPDGALIWMHSVSSAMDAGGPCPAVDGELYLATNMGVPELIVRPWIVQRRDGDEWTTIETSEE